MEPERVTKYRCECGLLHDTKAQANSCASEEVNHFIDIIDKPIFDRDLYGTVIRTTVVTRVDSEVGPVLVRRIARAKKNGEK